MTTQTGAQSKKSNNTCNYEGSVCGVQTGLQSLMDLIKYLLVVLLPKQNTFGFLIILSFLVGPISSQ